MSVRSDIGIALTLEAISLLKEKHRNAWSYIQFLSDRHFVHEEGELFIFKDIKWNHEYTSINTIHNALDNIDCDLYLLVEACGEYPTSVDNDGGAWWDNPFDLWKDVAVSLHYFIN